jgi:chorismate lyase/3-hydroxybenzoate synthase
MSIFVQEYLSRRATSSAAEWLNQDGVLAVIGYTGDCLEPASPGYIPSGLSPLGEVGFEVIRYPFGLAERGVDDGCHWNVIGDLLCAATWISPAECRVMEAATEQAYDRILGVAERLGFAFPFRIWNLISQINEGAGDQEIYKQFCSGRMRAFSRHGMEAAQYPAASAVGHHAEGAVIYLLAAPKPSRNLENPLQMPAYTYPREYGPCSPSFARATRIELGSGDFLFISGTASILGHSTQAPGDIVSQLEVTQANIAQLVKQAGGSTDKLSALRVYLRHADHLEQAKTLLECAYPAEHLNFVLADICRQQLLVEIEALVEL